MTVPIKSAPAQSHQLEQSTTYQLFLIITTEDIATPQNETAILQRITRFSNLAATPLPALAFILNTNPEEGIANGPQCEPGGIMAYAQLQTLYLFPPIPNPQPPTPDNQKKKKKRNQVSQAYQQFVQPTQVKHPFPPPPSHRLHQQPPPYSSDLHSQSSA
ncbi:MAG: hypothetical protein Q9217_001847 [Psora testacea]